MTLGKRIAAGRKGLGLTQDQLAEKLGITAQAVSKWENDQSCPDINTLLRLAELFHISTDELLGRQSVVHRTEADAAPVAESGWDREPGRRATVGLAVLVLLVGGLMLAAGLLGWQVSFWGILWPSALLVFGVGTLVSRFSFFRIGCAIFGGYFLLEELGVLKLRGELVFPVILLIVGGCLLLDVLFKSDRAAPSSKNTGTSRDFRMDGETFQFNASFGEQSQRVDMARLSFGQIVTSFGDYEIDLTGVASVVEDCRLEGKCSFGELTLLIPSRFRAQSDGSTAFASIETSGHPHPEPVGTIVLDFNVSFGHIRIRYV